WLLGDQGARSRRGTWVGAEGHPRVHGPDRGAPIPRGGRGLRPAVTDAEITRVFREEHGRAVAVLVRAFGDIDIAEDAVQDAFVAASERWPSAGMPPSPAGWIITTARNRAID